MQPAPETFKHCAVAPDMLLRRKWKGHITYGSAGGKLRGSRKVAAIAVKSTWCRRLAQHNVTIKLHGPVCEAVQASCSAASKALGVTEVFTNL